MYLTVLTPPIHYLYACAIRSEAIDRITEELLEKETLTGDEFRTMLAKYTTIPEENMRAVQEQAAAREAIAV